MQFVFALPVFPDLPAVLILSKQGSARLPQLCQVLLSLNTNLSSCFFLLLLPPAPTSSASFPHPTLTRCMSPVTATKHFRIFVVPCQLWRTWLSRRYLLYLGRAGVTSLSYNSSSSLAVLHVCPKPEQVQTTLRDEVRSLGSVQPHLAKTAKWKWKEQEPRLTRTDSISTSGTSETSLKPAVRYT